MRCSTATSITVGHHQLRFVDGEADEPQDEFEKTMVIQPRRAAARLRRSPRRCRGAAASRRRRVARQRRAAGPRRHAAPRRRRPSCRCCRGQFAGRELELIKALTTLGRPGVQVAAITRRADGFFIVHVDSGKPDDFPLVNGAPIGQQARKLHDNDVIQLAGVKMGFFEKLISVLRAARRWLTPQAARRESCPRTGAPPRPAGLAPQRHAIARPHGRQVGDVHRDHVHRHAPDQRRASAVDQHRRAGGGAARVAIAVTDSRDGDARVARRARQVPP